MSEHIRRWGPTRVVEQTGVALPEYRIAWHFSPLSRNPCTEFTCSPKVLRELADRLEEADNDGEGIYFEAAEFNRFDGNSPRTAVVLVRPFAEDKK